MTVVDSSVWIDFTQNRQTLQTDWLERNIGVRPLGITNCILCEVLQGVRSDADFRRLRTELSIFPMLLTGGEGVAVAAADNYRELRKRGKTVRSTIDCLTATVCILGGHSLLHGDRDFDAFEQHLGLQVIHPSTH